LCAAAGVDHRYRLVADHEADIGDRAEIGAAGELVERGIPESTRAELRGLGHTVSEIGACGIGAVVTHRDPESGVLSAGADPRRPTYALAW
jgi:gamma-glutamyltranspeptidase